MDTELGGGFIFFYVHPFLGKWSNLTTLPETNMAPENGGFQ